MSKHISFEDHLKGRADAVKHERERIISYLISKGILRLHPMYKTLVARLVNEKDHTTRVPLDLGIESEPLTVNFIQEENWSNK